MIVNLIPSVATSVPRGGEAFDARLAFCVSRIHQLEQPTSPLGGSVEAQKPSLKQLEAILYLIQLRIPWVMWC